MSVFFDSTHTRNFWAIVSPVREPVMIMNPFD
ncbi:hypothetical protein DCAR_0103605 [Daucus carota subsp. sativus]|uniref:Uncharacterized protein n=1 Tax=Daucus carota subsp. sativus TaxID=79200 RepID=A0A166I4Q4_DAUCS|nr:hypothetical protein DCAR_0103605 [Daucus carota subsp. sativus]